MFTRSFVAYVLTAASFALTAQADFYIRPHLNNITTDGCTLIWETTDESVGKIEYGLDKNYGQTVADSAPAKVHRLRMKDLKADTTYSYRVVAGGETKEAQFKTAPSEPRPITFVMIGDTRRWGNGWEESKMEEHAEQWHPEFYLIQGDLVVSGHTYNLWPEHFKRFANVNERLWMVTARGNHEGSNIFDKENDWFGKYHELPGDAEPYASFTWGNTFIALLSMEQVPGAAKWLDENLPKSNAKYKVVAQHPPVYCGGYYSADDKRKDLGDGIMRPLAASLDRNKVDLNVAGHTHIYERVYPLKDGKRDDAHGTTFIVNGGDCNANFPEPFVASNDLYLEAGSPTYTVCHMGEDRIWHRTFACKKSDKSIVQIDYGIQWRDEAVPKAALAKIGQVKGEEQAKAIEEIGAMSYLQAAPELIKFLDDPDLAVCRAAAHALALIGNPAVSGDLAKRLEDKDLYARREIARALEVGMDAAVAPAVAAAAADAKQDEITRVRLLGALQLHAPAELSTKTAFSVLASADAPKTVRQRASYGLIATATPADVAKIAQIFKTEEEAYVTLRLAVTLNKLTGARQAPDRAAKTPAGEERQALIDKWLASAAAEKKAA